MNDKYLANLTSIISKFGNNCGSETLLHISKNNFKCFICDKDVVIPEDNFSKQEYSLILKKCRRNKKLLSRQPTSTA